MKQRLLLLLAATLAMTLPNGTNAPSRAFAATRDVTQDNTGAFALSVLDLPPDSDDINVLETRWNGRAVLLVDYPVELPDMPNEFERDIVALWRTPTGHERARVTTGEQEGGEPRLAAIGFANADRDPADEMIVILTWTIRHYDVAGTLYNVRILDDAKPGQAELVELAPVSAGLNGYFCDCDRRDAPSDHFEFKTIADIKVELIRLGY